MCIKASVLENLFGISRIVNVFVLSCGYRLVINIFSVTPRGRHLNCVYTLDFEEEQWYEYSNPEGIKPTPRDKVTGWVHKDR